MTYPYEKSLRTLSEVILHLRNQTGRDDALHAGLDGFACRHSNKVSADPTQMENDPNRYLREYAIDDELQRRCRTYLVINEEAYRINQLDIIGYFTISVSMFDTRGFSAHIKNRLLGNTRGRSSGEYAPAYLIAQLACSEMTGRSEFSGASLLNFAEDVVEHVAELAGGNIIYLQCCDALIGYYKRFGYTHMISESDTTAPNIMVKLILADTLEDDLEAEIDTD